MSKQYYKQYASLNSRVNNIGNLYGIKIQRIFLKHLQYDAPYSRYTCVYKLDEIV